MPKLNVSPLSWLQLYWLVFGEALLVGISIVVSYFWEVAPTGDVLAYSSILFGTTGTALMILPSAITTFGKTEYSMEYKRKFRVIRDVLNRLSDGQTLTESDDGYSELIEYMDETYGLEKHPSEIRLSEEVTPPLLNFDGDNQFLSLSEFHKRLDENEEKIKETEGRVSEIRERNHVIAGGILYGFAIILQSINTFL